MSYILDALKKAERERDLAKVPTLATIHQPAKVASRRLWPWIAGAVVVASVAVLAWLMSSTPAPKLSMQPGEGLTGSARAVTMQAQPAQALPSESERAGSDARPESEGRKPAADVRLEGASRPPAESVRPEPDIRPPTPPAGVAEAVSVAEKPAATPAVAPPAAAGASPKLAASEILAKVRLQLLMYSENPSERLVFINNQKFLEGQSIDGKVTVERIMPDGVVLASQGERIVLRAEGGVRP